MRRCEVNMLVISTHLTVNLRVVGFRYLVGCDDLEPAINISAIEDTDKTYLGSNAESTAISRSALFGVAPGLDVRTKIVHRQVQDAHEQHFGEI